MSAADLLRGNDLRFLAAAQDLTVEEWLRPSLCTEWSNHEVLAHLVVGRSASVRDITAGMIRRRSFDRENTYAARTLAADYAPTELLNEYRGFIDQPIGIGKVFPRTLLLGDHVVHELDILFALERTSSIRSEILVKVLNTQVELPNPFVPAYFTARGLRLRATDAHWAHGNSGPVVEGAAAALASVLAGRPKMLAHLSGEGAAVLAERLGARSEGVST
ncbi:maleylpyruvate isomerase family mycothiol-dependent enzyme [Mycobacterium sp. D16R24]|uniref:maleylpyruvate isomerase family mycothiol-dependent enzyme n=1 Tax=Mycobacterium sp. D16R24 TaxID=1855656 RepID=UPI0009939A56|nr:maleylpyruvate isomerase family mycothiol-dependent enzyme [Mycobacterium sp. D16R24]